LVCLEPNSIIPRQDELTEATAGEMTNPRNEEVHRLAPGCRETKGHIESAFSEVKAGPNS